MVLQKKANKKVMKKHIYILTIINAKTLHIFIFFLLTLSNNSNNHFKNYLS